MNHEEYELAANYWNVKDANSVRMDPNELIPVMEEYIWSNNTCALATGSGSFVRCTPIEYNYIDGSFWLFSEGGLKFFALEHNQNVCLSIYDKFDGFQKLKGMQISGMAVIIEPFKEEYRKIAEYKKLSLEALMKLPHPLYLIRIKPTRIDFLNSEFIPKGYSSRQFIEF